MSESRIKLLEWVNETTDLHYTKVEQLGTGIAYAQILDSMYGDVQLSKLTYEHHERAYFDNFKVIQKAFKSHNIDKSLPIDRLVKCKFQDNFEFLKWFKSFWQKNHTDEPYGSATKHQKGRTSNEYLSISPTTNGDCSLPSSSSTAQRPVSNKITQLQQKITQLQATSKVIQEENQTLLRKLDAIKRVVAKSQSLKYNKPGSVVNTFKKINNILYNEKDDME